MKNKKNLLSLSKILIVCFIILIPVVIWIIAFHKMPIKQNNSPKAQVYSQKDNSPVIDNQQDANKLQQSEQYRQVLSASDAKVKIDLIRRGNPLAATEDYTIIYDPSIDIFYAQINTISIEFAKREVDQWFFDQGMSVEAPCVLPVNFTLKDSVAASLKGLHVVFSTLAPGC